LAARPPDESAPDIHRMGAGKPSHGPFGQKPATTAPELAEQATRRHCVPWPSSGFESFSAAGLIASPTTKPATCSLSKTAAPLCSSLPRSPQLSFSLLAVRLRAWLGATQEPPGVSGRAGVVDGV